MPAIFYPGANVRLQIRFEDFAPLPPLPAEPGVPGPQGAESFGPGVAQQVAGLAATSASFDVVPYDYTVELNSYRKADECRVTLPFSRVPFDPRIIRDATIQVFGGVFGPTEWAEANGPIGASGLVLPDAVPIGLREAGASNELFRGFVDEWDVNLTGEDRLTITARDLTGALLDQEIGEDFLRDLPQTLPLDQVIQLLLTGDGTPTPEASRRFGVPGFRGVLVVNEAGDLTPAGSLKLALGQRATAPGDRLPLPTLMQIRPPQWFDSKRTAKKGRKNSPGAAQKQSYWDAITDLCVSAGYIVFMRQPTTTITLPGGITALPATEIVIATPRTYYKDDGFVDLAGNRVFIYGSNVSDLKVQRKLGGVKVPTVEVRAFDPVTGLQLTSRYPPIVRKKNNRPGVSGRGEKEEVKTFLLDEVSGPTAPLQLEAAARSIYEQLGRNEFHVQIRTRHLAAKLENLDDGIEADLFRLRPGDTITVEIDRADPQLSKHAAHTLFTSYSPADRLQAMLDIGIPPNVASFAVTALESPFIQTEFRTQRVNISWDHNSGFEFQIDAINFLDVRDSVQAIDGVPT